MPKNKKEIKQEEVNFDSLWILMLFLLIFGNYERKEKVINIYMGDGE